MNTLIKTGFFLLASLLCFNFPLSYAFEATEDVTGASDSQFFKRYPRSKIDSYSQAATDDYLLALGAPKTVNGVMVLEYSERLSGSLTRYTYRSPDAEPSKLVFAHFQTQLVSLSHRVLFECHGRECGSSNQWANRIFDVRKLYGPERHQHYLAAQLNTDKGPLFVALYSIQRGNKRVYTQLDLLTPDSNSAMALDVNPDTILATLKSDGVFNLRNLQFDQDDKLTTDSTPRLSPVVAALNKNSRLKFYVAGHLAENGSLDSLKARSLMRAESVLQALVEQGIRAERLSAQGVGPLAPIKKDSDDANRIGLVLQ
jgi:outer membrane protein OmpA-like peptidoglycan-associated protein